MQLFPNGLRTLLLLCLVANLVACDGQKTNYIEEGKRLYKAGDYKKARLAFDNAAAVDPENIQGRYELAEELSQLGDIQDAARQYQIVVNQDARHVMARVKLGQIYLLASKIEAAEKMADEALAVDAENVDAMVLMGNVLAAQNNSDAAFVKAEAALQKTPDDVGASLLLASLTAKTGKLDKAIALLQGAIGKHAENTAMRLMLAKLYSQHHDLEKAEATLAAVVKIEPESVEHRKRWAVFLVNNKQVDKAETVLRAAVAELPDDEQAKLMLVDFLAAQRTPEIAIAELIPMIEQNAGQYELRFKLADLQLAQKQADKVEETLKEIVELDKQGPQSIEARNKLARLYKASRRVDEAKSLVKELLDGNPDDLAALTLRGEIALAENRVPDAITDFRSVLSEQPKNVAVLKLLGAAHLVNKDTVLARENLEQIVGLVPGDEIARLDLVNLLLQAGDKEQATQQLNTLFRLNPNSKNGLEALFKIYATQKQWDKALNTAKQLQQAHAGDAAGYYLSGLAYRAEGKLEQSTLHFEQAVQRQPHAVEPLSQLVKNYLMSKEADKALSKLHDVLEKQPKNFFAYNLLGEVYARGNKYGDAVKAYQQAIVINPAWSVPYRNIALIHILQKHKNDAIDILRKGIDSTAESMELEADLAALYDQDGEHQKVIDLYEDSFRKHPESLNRLNNLASYLAEHANGAEALARAAKLAGPLAEMKDPYMLDTVAWIAYKQGDYEKSRQLLLQAFELNPDIAVSDYHRGMVYFKQGDKGRAQEYLHKAIDKKVDFNGLAEAKETLKALEKNTQ
ncbi:MAG: tetratricopeptide repeat protein [Methylovulum sp.]|nr:MAG: tetratricopeptide repeat protein [Methylovulum sp.]